ncbi:Uncharacterized protein RDABS01_025762 [Bienertia sinuspersici]
MAYEDRYLQAPKYDCLLFDLDDTLYPISAGLSNEVLKNIQDFMVDRLGIDRSKINDLSNVLYKNYGTTMAGLRAIGYDFDNDEYHSFVHGKLPYENLRPDPILRSLLLGSPVRKVIFTNADKNHALQALSKLGLEDCFEGVICFETLNPIQKNFASDDEDDIKFLGSKQTNSLNNNTEIFDIVAHLANHNNDAATLPKTPIVCKPSESAMEQALKIANLNPQRTIFFDDSVRNIMAGKRVGLHTVLSIHNLREALPELWEADVRAEVYSDKISRETSVIA